MQDAYESIEESRGGVRGPFGVLMNSPEVAVRIGELGAYIRFGGVLDGAVRELAIITTAREFECAYEWVAHTPIARQEGVSEEAIEVVADNDDVDDVSETDAVVIEYGRQLFREHRVDSETFAEAQERFGVEGITELTATMGYYAMLACALNAFEVLPENPPGDW